MDNSELRLGEVHSVRIEVFDAIPWCIYFCASSAGLTIRVSGHYPCIK